MKKLAAALALSLAAFGAHAQGFMEIGVGQSKFDFDAPSPAAVDDTDTTVAVSAGYMFTPILGAEIGYRDLGETSASQTILGSAVRATAEVNGITLGAVGRFALGERLSIVPRAGLYLWDGKGRGSVNGAQVAGADDDGTDLYFGVGADYSFTRQWYAGAHWARFDIDGDDVDVLELRVGFRF